MLARCRGFAGGVLLFMLAASVHAADWVQTWGAAPLPPTQAQGPFPATPSFSNQTLRQTVRISAGGGQIRIRFTNEYGSRPLQVGAARVALLNDKGEIQPNTVRPVLFGGAPTAQIPAGAPLLSDPVDLAVKPLASLSISIYLPQDTGPCTCHSTGQQTLQISDSGDYTAVDFTPKQTSTVRAFLSGVLVAADRHDHSIVVLGDSISDGIGSTVDANRRWPDLLAARLAEQRHPPGVVNMGISGNQVLADGAGQSALARFDRDVLAVPGVKVVIIFEGVNDLGIAYGGTSLRFGGEPGPKVTPESMIAGYRQLITRAHAAGLKVIAATITPYEGAAYYSPQGEAVRQAINQWMRKTHELDGVIDFDARIRDPDKPTQIKADFTQDHLHSNDAGYAAMAAAVDLGLLE
jgi:lysophospholipase L1-like esterase